MDTTPCNRTQERCPDQNVNEKLRQLEGVKSCLDKDGDLLLCACCIPLHRRWGKEIWAEAGSCDPVESEWAQMTQGGWGWSGADAIEWNRLIHEIIQNDDKIDAAWLLWKRKPQIVARKARSNKNYQKYRTTTWAGFFSFNFTRMPSIAFKRKRMNETKSTESKR